MSVVGFVVKAKDKEGKERVVSRKFDSRDACSTFAELYRKTTHEDAWVFEVNKIDAIDRDNLNRRVE